MVVVGSGRSAPCAGCRRGGLTRGAVRYGKQRRKLTSTSAMIAACVSLNGVLG